jgi:ABC-type iron transport system FetAB permease component
MADQIMATIALLMFLIFVMFLAVYINSVDLWVVLVAVAMMAATDFVQTLRAEMNKPENNKK